MGIKIWTVEKFQRMMTTMFETETGEQPELPAAFAKQQERQSREADLRQLLQAEKKTGNAERVLPAKDLVQLKGYYIYIHDMEELTRPVMIREYPKVTRKEDGEWPQFRSVPSGKCPFVEDAASVKKAQQREEEARLAARKQLQLQQTARRTRAAAALEAATAQSASQQRDMPLREVDNNASHPVTLKTETSKPLDPPKSLPARHSQAESNSLNSMPPLLYSAQPNFRGLRQFPGGEPVASGIQPSNVTSAIRSQVISSTAAAPSAARAGAFRDLQKLQRRVLEQSGPCNPSISSSHMNDLRAATNAERPLAAPTTRGQKRKAEALAQINEDENWEAEAAQKNKLMAPRKQRAAPREERTKKEAKPGYCENCKEKFDDFSEVGGLKRKHLHLITFSFTFSPTRITSMGLSFC